MRDLMLRLSTKEDEIKKLKQDKENLDKECLKHSRKLAELEVLNERNRETMAEIRQLQHKCEEPETGFHLRKSQFQKSLLLGVILARLILSP